MELGRVEAICSLESSSRSRLWGTRGDRAGTQEVAVFGLGLSRNTGVAYVGELRTSSTKGVQFLQDGTQRSLGSWPSLLVLSRRCSKAESGLSIQSGFLSLVGAANAMMMIPPPIARASSRTAIPRLGTSPLS